MTFASMNWLGWMVFSVVLFWAMPARHRLHTIIAITMAFLFRREPISLVWLAALTTLTYLLTRGARPGGKRTTIAVVPVVTLLLTYKVVSASSGDDLISGTVIPLGLSYYALRCIHYALERYKGNIRDLGPTELVGYLFFLPTIFVGPIHRFPEWRRDMSRHRWDPILFGEGLERIVNGYVKITFLGNFLVSGVFLDWVSRSAADGSAQELYLRMVSIGLNLYFQFSGFSDVAIGFSGLLGFRVMENFHWPFLQRNISDFWKSWHISLTSWSRDYVYTSTIAVTRSPAIGVLASLIAIALWHEVSLRYLLWGAYHGLGIIIWQQSRRLWSRCPPIQSKVMLRSLHGLSILTTVHFVFLGFLLVREPDVGGMIEALRVLTTEWA